MNSSPSVMKQLFRGRPRRGLGRVPQGVGQASLSSTTACNNWVVIPQSDPMWNTITAAVHGAGWTSAQLVNEAWHFLFTMPPSVPASSILGGAVSPNQPVGTILMKINAEAGADISQSVLYACISNAASAAVQTGNVAAPATTTAASSSTPYIIAGIAGVVILGALVYYATE
jgi:hypothetical protein